MTILLLADLHGSIFLAFKLAARLQRERGLKLDLILQCGDMGIYPDTSQLDKATLRHARHDDTELGFSRYFVQPHKDVQSVLNELSCDMVCVRGNHEDHAFLDRLEQASTESRFPVDCYQRVFVGKTGHIQTFGSGDETLQVASIGRIGYRGNKKPTEAPRYIQHYEREALRKLRKQASHLDILLSHDCPLHFFDKDFGMTEIREFLNFHKPFYHFYGHTGHPYQAVLDDNGFTTSVKIAELEWQNGSLPDGSLVLLHWNGPYDHRLEVIEDSWLYEYTPDTWLYL